MTVFAGLRKGSPNLHLGAQELLPLVPGLVPDDGHDRLVHHHLKLSPGVAVQGAVAVELKLAQRRPEAPLPAVRKEGNDSPDKERLPVAGAPTQHDDRSKTAAGK